MSEVQPVVGTIKSKSGDLSVKSKGSKKSNGSQKSEERERWSSDWAFLVAAIGAAVGIGNVWRFPAKNYEYGGGAFFIPYFISFMTYGIPLLILEIALGQHFQGGSVKVFGRMNPRHRMIGFSSVYMGFLLVSYYSPLVCWFVRMFFESFKGEEVQWTTNDYKWKDAGGFEWVSQNVVNGDQYIPDDMNWKNFGCLCFVYACVFGCLAFGVKVTGILSYITVIFPAIMICVLLVTSCTMNGAGFGVKNYIGKWDLSILADTPTCWSDAAAQIFFSTGVVISVMSAFGSYNDQGNNPAKHSVIIATANSFYSIVAGFAVFGALGFLSHERSVEIIRRTAVWTEQNAQLTIPAEMKENWDRKQLYRWQEYEGGPQEEGLTMIYFDDLSPSKQVTIKDGNSEKILKFQWNQEKFHKFIDQFNGCSDHSVKTALDCAKDGEIQKCIEESKKKIDKCPEEYCEKVGDKCQRRNDKGIAKDDLLEKMQIKGASGMKLAFGTYPVVLSELPAPHFWQAMFFITLVFLGVDTVYGILEGTITFVMDTSFGKHLTHLQATALVLFTSFLTCLPYVTNAGYVLLDVVDFYVNITLLFVALVEFMSAGWLQGFSQTIEKCGRLAVAFSALTVFLPVVVISVGCFAAELGDDKNEIPTTKIGFATAIPLMVVLFIATCIIAITTAPSKNTLSKGEILDELFFGNVERLRLTFNSYFVKDHLNAPWWHGIPAYCWGFCIKFWAPPTVILLLCINFFAVIDVKDPETGLVIDRISKFSNYEGYGGGYQAIGIFFAMFCPVSVIFGLFAPVEWFNWMDRPMTEKEKKDAFQAAAYNVVATGTDHTEVSTESGEEKKPTEESEE